MYSIFLALTVSRSTAFSIKVCAWFVSQMKTKPCHNSGSHLADVNRVYFLKNSQNTFLHFLYNSFYHKVCSGEQIRERFSFATVMLDRFQWFRNNLETKTDLPAQAQFESDGVLNIIIDIVCLFTSFDNKMI